MRLPVAASALACALATQGVPAADADSDWSLIEGRPPGAVFPGGQVPAHPAPGGFALIAIDGRWQLVPAILVAHADPPAPADGRVQDIAIEATPAGALVYLRLPGLRAGKVDTPDLRFQGVHRDLALADVRLPFKGSPWRFERRHGSIWLTDGSRRQDMGALPQADSAGNKAAIQLAWAGDLDRDGKLDVVIRSASDHGWETCVWLSSQSAPGDLLASAACQGS